MLHINDLTYRIGDRVLFDNATARVPVGAKVGFVGRNGTGKSTLLNLITGRLAMEGGDIRVHPRARMTLVAQEAPDGPTSLVETVVAAHKELHELETRAETETDPNELADIHTRLADLEAHSARARAARILAGLGFDEEAQARGCDTFSGGWRMRVALAGALFSEPDLLLLDEPTNYLDLEGVLWLEQALRDYPRTVLIVSHDRNLLNRAVGSILHLSEGKLNIYAGGYDRFEQRRREAQERQLSMKAKQEAERRHIQSFVDRFRYKATKAKQAQSRLKMLEKMTPIASVVEEHTVPFSFPDPEPLPPPLISIEDCSVGYEPGKPILSDLDLRIDMDDRIALLGPNGNGKSTFAKLLSDRLKAEVGKLRKPRKLRVGYFAQHQLDELREGDTVYNHMKRLMPDATEAKVRARLGGFGFSFDKADRKVETLSGGEKARLLFALISHNAPHLLILDEPTNHLDVDSREALIHALNTYDGAIILISHDRHLQEACVDRLWVVAEGTVSSYEGDLETYRRETLSRRGVKARRERKEKVVTDSPAPPSISAKDARKLAAEARQRLAPLSKRVKEAEQMVARLATKKAELDVKIADPNLYSGEAALSGDEIKTLQMEHADMARALQDAETEWLEAEAALEDAKAAQ